LLQIKAALGARSASRHEKRPAGVNLSGRWLAGGYFRVIVALLALLLFSGGPDDYLLGRECIDRKPAVRVREGRGSDQPGLRHFKAARCAVRHSERCAQRAARPCVHRDDIQRLPRCRADEKLGEVR
jgi:hypothetical protein